MGRQSERRAATICAWGLALREPSVQSRNRRDRVCHRLGVLLGHGVCCSPLVTYDRTLIEYLIAQAPFYKYCSPLLSIMHAPPPPVEVCLSPPERESWPERWARLLKLRSPQVYDEFIKEAVLSEKGQRLKDVREFLRGCVEVGVRGWGNLEAAKGAWVVKVEEALGALEC